ncbi:MAG: DUF3899 domain-containing protein [Bacillus sp. (in: firmicutes)]
MLGKLKNRTISIIVLLTLLLTILLSLLIHKELSLLHFINISFYFCSAYIMAGALFLVIDRGFFDGISYSFRKMFRNTNKMETEDDKNEIIPLSELFTMPYSSLLYSGLIIMAFMLVGLWLWY